ncbi:MAG: hypothetical protein AAF802_15245 [Planctomycetota bacterium]
MLRRPFLFAFVTVCIGGLAFAKTPSLQPGPVQLASIGPMTFATNGILLVGDPKTATLYALDTEDTPGTASDIGNGESLEIADLAKAIGTTLNESDAIAIGELAANPETGNVFLSVTASGATRIVKITRDKTISELNLDKIPHASKSLPNPPEDKAQGRRRRNPRQKSITDLAFFDGKVMVTGLSAGDAPSRVLEFEFPFTDAGIATSVEIFHAAHGRVETPAIETFLPMMIDGEPSVLAGFTCTPLVRFPIDELSGGSKVRGTTVAELGNRNRPLDMVVYEKDGKTSILMSNSSRGMMKISTEGIGQRETLTEKVSGGGTAGQPFETIESLASVVQMDKIDDAHAIAILEQRGTLTLKTIALP